MGQSAACHNDQILIANIFQKSMQQLSRQLEEEKYKQNSWQCVTIHNFTCNTLSRNIFVFVFVFVFIYLPHNYNNYKEMPKKKVGRNGEEAERKL